MTEDKKISFKEMLREMSTFMELVGDQKPGMIKAACFTIFFTAIGFIPPLLMKEIFDSFQLIAMKGDQSQSVRIYWLIAGSFTFFFISKAIHYFWRNRTTWRSQVTLENRWPIQTQRKLLSLSLGYHEKENSAGKAMKVWKGSDRLLTMVSQLTTNVVYDISYVIINIVIVSLLDWRLCLVLVAPIIPAVYLQSRFWDRMSPFWEKNEKLNEKSNILFQQSVVNVATVQNFGTETDELSRHSQVRAEIGETSLEIMKTATSFNFWMDILINVFSYVAIAASIILALNGQVLIGTVVYLINTTGSSLQNIRDLIGIANNFMDHFHSVRRMRDLMRTEVDLPNLAEGVSIPNLQGNLAFQNVMFSYDTKAEQVLKGLSFEVKNGEMVALVGSTGSGKTTTVKLLTQMYRPASGNITLDGHDIKDLDLHWYRRLFAVVHQNIDIFDGTVRDNIVYGNQQAADDLIDEAVRASQLNQFLDEKKRFPLGLSTLVGERGVKLSGGEKQRVAIARAYIALKSGARVLILDEATSSLDSATEQMIQAVIEKLRAEKQFTIVAIAHRLSTIHKADKIVVIESGKVVDQGDHASLIKRNGLYARLVKLQQEGLLRD